MTSSSISPIAPRQNLYRRVMSAVSLIMLFMTLFVAIGVTNFVYRAEQAAWQTRRIEAGRSAALTIDTFIHEIQNYVMLVGTLDRQYLEDNPRIMHRLLEQNQALLELMRLDREGNIFAVAHRNNAPVLAHIFTIRLSSWFSQARAGQAYIGNLQLSATDEPYIIVAMPAADGGVVAGRLRMNVLWDVVSSSRFGQTGIVYMVDREGNLVAHPGRDNVLQRRSLALRPEMAAALAAPDHEWQGAYFNFEDENVVGFTTPVSGGNWLIFAEISRDETLRLTYQAAAVLGGGVLALGILMTVLTSFVLRRLVLWPLERLRAGVARFGLGELDYRLESERPDELGQLALAFNDMAAHLKQRQERIVQQERLAAVGQLSAGIAHDFNNILTSMLGFAELLRQAPDTPEAVRDDLARIIGPGQRAAHLVHQMLDFSRQSIRRPQPLDLTPLLKEIVRFLERTIPENIRLELEILPGEYQIEADPTQMQQMLTNLAINARDAMATGGLLRVVLSRAVFDGEATCLECHRPITGKWVQITVADTGSGIPPDVLPHIFEPFFTTKAAGNGTGLGLAQVLGIVQQHAGHISIDSREGGGTTFTVCLPPLPGPVQISQAKAAAIPEQQGRGELILLVEDEALVLEASRRMLQRLGYQVLTAKNGREASEIYRDHRDRIDLVLSDMVMPDMEGLALFTRLKQQNPDIKMVLMSGYPLQEKEACLLEEGIVDWFQKPVSFAILAETIGRVLSRR